MHSLSTPYRTGQEEVGFIIFMLGASRRAEVLHAARRAMPVVASLLVANTGPARPAQPTLAGTERTQGVLNTPACALDAPLPITELSARTHNALLKSRITTIRQFCTLELRDLMWLRNFGKKALADAVAYRARLGYPINLPE